jgi:hypothetical protein
LACNKKAGMIKIALRMKEIYNWNFAKIQKMLLNFQVHWHAEPYTVNIQNTVLAGMGRLMLFP